jgi:hypothetical protein
MLPPNLYARVQLLLCANSTRDRGCGAHPVFPAPSHFDEGERDANLGQSMSRERRLIFTCHRPALCAIAHQDRATQYSETSMIEPRSRGVLDPPHARRMTAVCAAPPPCHSGRGDKLRCAIAHLTIHNTIVSMDSGPAPQVGASGMTSGEREGPNPLHQFRATAPSAAGTCPPAGR